MLFATKNILPYSDGRHGVGGDEDGDALREGHDWAHEAPEGPVIQHESDLNITFSESFDIAPLTFLVIIAIQKLYLCDVWTQHTLKVSNELFRVEEKKICERSESSRKGQRLLSNLAHHGEWNVEGCHEEVTQGEVCNEEVGDGVESPGPDDDTEH